MRLWGLGHGPGGLCAVTLTPLGALIFQRGPSSLLTPRSPPKGGGGGAVKRCVYTQVCAVGTSTTNYDRFGNSILGKRSSPSCPAPFGSYQLFSEHKAKSRCAAAFRGLIDPGKSLSFPCQSRRRAAVVEKSNRIRELRFQSNIALLARSLLHRCPLLMEHSETTIEV